MKTMKISLLALSGIMLLTGCAYRYYLGMHGPSVSRHPDIHAGITTDEECLGCHGSQSNPRGPATSHPQFTGCLKCHNDELNDKKPSSLQ
jgi:hypothetical protein